MRYAIIENGKVVNTTKSAEPLAENWVQSDTAKKGDDYLEGVFTTPTPVALIPKLVSMAQARKALVMGGITMASVDAAIAAIVDDAARELAQIDWEYEIVVRRDSPLVSTLGTSLSLTDAQIDALFVAAQAL